MMRRPPTSIGFLQGDGPTLIDLFCGCGGMSLGAARAGFEIAAAIDNDLRALAVHKLNFPRVPHLLLDLATASGEAILKAAKIRSGAIDVVVGGPPCQGFSVIGKRDIADARNQLFGHFFRLVAELRPRAFVVENVPGILEERYRELVAVAFGIVERDYDLLEACRITATAVGAPTVRTRAILVGFLKLEGLATVDFWNAALNQVPEAPVVRHALDGLPLDIHPDPKESNAGKRTVRVTRTGSFFDAVTGRIPPGVGNRRTLDDYVARKLVTGCIGTRHSPALEYRYAALAFGETDKKTKSVRLDPNGFCPTLRAGTGPDKGSFQAVRPIHYCRPRVITPREAARLQGFPDWFQLDETKWHAFRQIGSSVSPFVSEAVLSEMARIVQKS